MDVRTIIFWLFVAALIWFLLSSLSNRNRRVQLGGMDPGVFDQMAANATGIEDSYLLTPEASYGYPYYGLGAVDTVVDTVDYGYPYGYIY